MAMDFQKVLVKDDRLDVADSVKYAVVKGGQNVTQARFNAVSASNSQLTFNIQVPSEQTIIDRRVLLKTTLKLVIDGVNGTSASLVGFQVGSGYGSSASLAPFPLHQLMSTASATINNNTVTMNVQDVLASVMRLLDKRDLACYNGTTPTYQDSYATYGTQSTQFGGALPLDLANPLGSYNNVNDTDIVPRGSFVLKSYTNTGSTASAGVFQEILEFEITEPLLLSPFIFGNPKSNAQGFYGIQNFNFVFNIGSANRVFRGLKVGPYDLDNNSCRTASTDSYITGVSLYSQGQGAFSDTELQFVFLTPHPSDLLPARNIVPFYELPRYLTQTNATWTSATGTTNPTASANPANTGVLLYGQPQTISTQSIQLNQIPDKLVLLVRKRLGNQTFCDTDSGLVITGLNINFNNNSGLLASATQEQLYRMTKDNCSNLNWQEFCGRTIRQKTGSQIGNITVNAGVYTVVPAPTITTVACGMPTIGTFLVLEFGKDIQLVEDFYAPGSLGNFNLQINLTVANQNLYAITGGNSHEIVVITMNSGVFVCERGTSSTYTGILTKQDVLEASDQVAYTNSDVNRLVGGSFLDKVKSSVQKMAPVARAVAPVAKNLLKLSSDPRAQLASNVIGAFGYGNSGGRRADSRC